MTDVGYKLLEVHLGVSAKSLQLLRVGWSAVKQSYSFPMRSPDGQVIGIRYRALNDAKFSEIGGREGLFFQPSTLLGDYLIIVEGASDTAAMITIGYPSVVGRSNCIGNVDQLVTLCRRLSPHRVVIAPDNDEPGIRGAELLARALPREKSILNLPTSVKDVRACIQTKKDADWLRDQIGNLISLSTTGKTT
jgi:DNA primase